MRDFENATAPLLREIVGHARSHGDRIAIRCGRNAHDYAKLARRFERVTAHLSGTHGVQPGQHVATLAANDDLQLVILLACLRLGAVWAPLDPSATPDALQHWLQQADASLIVADEANLPVAQALATQRADIRCVVLDRLIDHPAPYGLHYPDVESEVPALMLFDAEAAGKATRYRQNRLLVEDIDIAPEDNVLVALPLARFASLLLEAVPALARGATVTLLPGFTPAAWLEALANTRPTVAAVTVDMMETLRVAPGWQDADFSSLRRLTIVDGPPQLALATALVDRGVPLQMRACPQA
ncbi:long-chain fatty acid--CoA ligase [Imbroritus primus]|uniref:Long-chain fatty acid--CoA ligase n=1 Tax=Imbroritus primus TaxID=3058603 RepID=A0ACD3SKW1_9BURK|nr:long-chain fatty acid--CoA ligase [Burkholderiaceae bacterium PBA]